MRVKAIKTIADRKIAFNQYIDELKAKERNEARLRRQQVRTHSFNCIAT
jgi:hypothetical protein